MKNELLQALKKYLNKGFTFLFFDEGLSETQKDSRRKLRFTFLVVTAFSLFFVGSRLTQFITHNFFGAGDAPIEEQTRGGAKPEKKYILRPAPLANDYGISLGSEVLRATRVSDSGAMIVVSTLNTITAFHYPELNPVVMQNAPQGAFQNMEIFASDTRMLIASENSAGIWNLETGAKLFSLEGEPNLRHAVIDPSGEIIVGIDDRTGAVCSYKSADGSFIGASHEFSGLRANVGFSVYGDLLTFEIKNGLGAVTTWNLKSLKPEKSVPVDISLPYARFVEGNYLTGDESLTAVSDGENQRIERTVYWSPVRADSAAAASSEFVLKPGTDARLLDSFRCAWIENKKLIVKNIFSGNIVSATDLDAEDANFAGASDRGNYLVLHSKGRLYIKRLN